MEKMQRNWEYSCNAIIIFFSTTIAQIIRKLKNKSSKFCVCLLADSIAHTKPFMLKTLYETGNQKSTHKRAGGKKVHKP